jgi:hypothetical protein
MVREYDNSLISFFIHAGGGVCNLRGMNVSEKLPCATTGDIGVLQARTT